MGFRPLKINGNWDNLKIEEGIWIRFGFFQTTLFSNVEKVWNICQELLRLRKSHKILTLILDMTFGYKIYMLQVSMILYNCSSSMTKQGVYLWSLGIYNLIESTQISKAHLMIRLTLSIYCSDLMGSILAEISICFKTKVD